MSAQTIASSFARSAARYDAHAQAQFQCAAKLMAYMEANTRDLVEGGILEVGCGTGLVSRGLAELFGERELEITDVSEDMLGRCRMRLEASRSTLEACGPRYELHAGEPRALLYSVVDVRQFEAEREYALAVAAFVLQWIDELPATLRNLDGALKPGGKLFFSVPTDGSFPEWKAICKRAGVSYTGNALPSAAQFRAFAAEAGLRLSLYEETFPVHHRSLQQFLLSLKSIGAGTALSPARLTIAETKRLLQAARQSHPNGFTATYKVLFGHFSKPNQERAHD